MTHSFPPRRFSDLWMAGSAVNPPRASPVDSHKIFVQLYKSRARTRPRGDATGKREGGAAGSGSEAVFAQRLQCRVDARDREGRQRQRRPPDLSLRLQGRKEERRVGKECVSKCKSRVDA